MAELRRTTTEARTCSSCMRAFYFDPLKFTGRRPPGICYPCQEARRARLVPSEGVVEETGPVYATIHAASGTYYWRHNVVTPADRPRVGDRVKFAFDPQDHPPGGRLPIARRVEPRA